MSGLGFKPYLTKSADAATVVATAAPAPAAAAPAPAAAAPAPASAPIAATPKTALVVTTVATTTGEVRRPAPVVVEVVTLLLEGVVAVVGVVASVDSEMQDSEMHRHTSKLEMIQARRLRKSVIEA